MGSTKFVIYFWNLKSISPHLETFARLWHLFKKKYHRVSLTLDCLRVRTRIIGLETSAALFIENTISISKLIE